MLCYVNCRWWSSIMWFKLLPPLLLLLSLLFDAFTAGDVWLYSNCVMSFVLYPTKSEYCCNILQTQTEQFKSSLYHCLSHSLSLVILEKVYIYSYAFWADFKSVSVVCVNRRLWDENPLRSKCFSSLVLLCKCILRFA